MNDKADNQKKKEKQSFKEYFDKWSQAHGDSTLSSRHIYYYWLRLAYYIAKKLDKIGITANQASYLGVFFAALTIPVYLFWVPMTQIFNTAVISGIILTIFIIFCGLMDNVDGALARMQESENRAGEVHDLIADRLSDIFLIIGPLIAGLASLPIGLMALFSIILFEVYRSFHISIGIEMVKSLVERQWRIFLQAIYVSFFSIAISFWNWIGVKIEPITQSTGLILNYTVMYLFITGLCIASLIYTIYKVRQHDLGTTILNIDSFEKDNNNHDE
jgi:phosphatidylglycerophosphate synthase